MKLRTKILAGYGSTLLLVILVCGWGVVNLRRLGKASEAILRENYRSILAAENMIDAIERQDSATLLILLGDKEKGTDQFWANEVVFLQWLGRAKDNITIPGEQQLILSLETRYKTYINAVSELQNHKSTQTPIPVDYYYETVFPLFESVRQNSTELRELNQQTMVSASERTQRLSHQAIWSMTLTGGTAAGLGME